MKIFILFPDNLYEDVSNLYKVDKVIICNDYLTSHRPYKYHPSKLKHMRDSMEFYKSYLKQKCITYSDDLSKVQSKDTSVYLYEPNDILLKRKYTHILSRFHSVIYLPDLPNFILSYNDPIWQRQYKRHSAFFQKVKERLNVLVNVKSTDKDNQRSMTMQQASSFHDIHTTVPTTFTSAKKHLRHFLKAKFASFGKYQDYIIADAVYVNHSNISAALNIGLLTPHYVLKKLIKYSRDQNISMNNLEGFIRQLIGWREYMRYLYHQGLNEDMIENQGHLWGRTKLPIMNNHIISWDGLSILEKEAEKVKEYGYAHHIVRLMLFLNWFVINRIHAKDVTKWFSENFVDVYPWAMTSNILSMGYFTSDYTHKPYITSASYLKRMSNYPDDGWADRWNKVYSDFSKRISLNRIF